MSIPEGPAAGGFRGSAVLRFPRPVIMISFGRLEVRRKAARESALLSRPRSGRPVKTKGPLPLFVSGWKRSRRNAAQGLQGPFVLRSMAYQEAFAQCPARSSIPGASSRLRFPPGVRVPSPVRAWAVSSSFALQHSPFAVARVVLVDPQQRLFPGIPERSRPSSLRSFF